MKSFRNIHFEARDFIDDTPDILRAILDQRSNLVLWKRSPHEDIGSSLHAYLADLGNAHMYDPENLVTTPHKTKTVGIELANGESLKFAMDERMLAVPGYEYLLLDIRAAANEILRQVDRPMTFYPDVKNGFGLSNINFMAPAEVLKTRLHDVHKFHIDGSDIIPAYEQFDPNPEIVPITIIINYMGAPTVGLKASVVGEATDALMKLPNMLSGWDQVIDRIEKRAGQVIYQPYGQFNVGVMARMNFSQTELMAKDMAGVMFEMARHVLHPHKTPELDERDGPRLTAILHAHIGIAPQIT